MKLTTLSSVLAAVVSAFIATHSATAADTRPPGLQLGTQDYNFECTAGPLQLCEKDQYFTVPNGMHLCQYKVLENSATGIRAVNENDAKNTPGRRHFDWTVSGTSGVRVRLVAHGAPFAGRIWIETVIQITWTDLRLVEEFVRREGRLPDWCPMTWIG